MRALPTSAQLGKALRVFLVFVLTFGLTLHVEYLALADGEQPPETTTETPASDVPASDPEGSGSASGPGSGEEPGGAQEPVSSSSGGPEDSPGSSSSAGASSSSGSADAGGGGSSSASGGAAGSSGSTGAGGESSSSGAVGEDALDAKLADDEVISGITVHQYDAAGKYKLGDAIRSVPAGDGGDKQKVRPKIEKAEGSIHFPVTFTVEGEGGTRQIDAAGYVAWSIEKNDIAVIDPRDGVVRALGLGNGSVTVTCTLKDDCRERVSDELEEKFGEKAPKVSFELDISGQAEPYVNRVTILPAEGDEFAEGRVLTLPRGSDGTYRFRAEVEVCYPNGDAEPEKKTFVLPLEDGDEGVDPADERFTHVEWSVDSDGSSAIDETGAFSLGDAQSATVTCTFASDVEEGRVPPDSVTVRSAEAPYIGRLEILDEAGAPCAEELFVDVAPAPATYRFGLRMTVIDPETDGEAVYERTEAGWVAVSGGDGASGGDGGPVGEEIPLADFPYSVIWSVSGEAASIDADGVLTLTSDEPAIVACEPASEGGEGDRVTVNPRQEEGMQVVLSYKPVPRGQTAFISSYITGVSGITYITYWQELQADGTWDFTTTQVGSDEPGSQELERPTIDPYIGRQYRAQVSILDDDGSVKEVANSRPVTIVEGDSGIRLTVRYVPEGEYAYFRVIPFGDNAGSRFSSITWWEYDGEQWSEVAEAANSTSYSVLTERSRFGHLFRVLATVAGASQPEESNVQMLAALDHYAEDETSEESTPDGEEDSADDEPDDPEEGLPAGSAVHDDGPPDAGEGAEPVDGAGRQTLSDLIDAQGRATVEFDDGSRATMRPVGAVRMANGVDVEAESSASTPHADAPSDILIDPAVNEEVAEAREAELATQVGARWNPVYFPDQEFTAADVLEGNPLAPFVLPFGLALLATGVVEKLVRYREQKRLSTATF